MTILRVGPPDFEPGVVIFDKDGTLIHFDWMWGGWVTELADRVEAATGLAAREPLFAAMGFEAAQGRVLPHGKLAVTPMAQLYELTVQVLRGCGAGEAGARKAVAEAWFAPDPVALAKPFTDLGLLFGALKARGAKVAVATTDDREPTLATLQGLGVWPLVDAMICADDGVPVKPAPDMVTTICARVSVPVARAVMVGDSTADLRMGRAAGAGLVVGVLSGVSDEAALGPLADVVIESIAELV